MGEKALLAPGLDLLGKLCLIPENNIYLMDYVFYKWDITEEEGGYWIVSQNKNLSFLDGFHYFGCTKSHQNHKNVIYIFFRK